MTFYPQNLEEASLSSASHGVGIVFKTMEKPFGVTDSGAIASYKVVAVLSKAF